MGSVQYSLMYVKKLGGHPVQEILQKAVDLVVSEGHYTRTQVGLGTGDEAIFLVCIPEQRIVAAMSFERSDGAWRRALRVLWAWVEPDHRRRGLHSTMIEAVCRIAKRDGYTTISRSTSAQNIGMIKAIESQGAKLVSVVYEHRLSTPGFMLGDIDDKFELAGPEYFSLEIDSPSTVEEVTEEGVVVREGVTITGSSKVPTGIVSL